MTTISRKRLPGCCASRISLAAMLALCACEPAARDFFVGGYRYDVDQFEQWKLPNSLREISGLAETPDGRLFAHGDERAIIRRLDYRSGKLLESFSLSSHPDAGGKAVKGDFEGIAVVGDDVYLVTSRGTMLAARPGPDGSAVAFKTYQTGLGDICEIEGLAYHAKRQALLLACKDVYRTELRNRVVVFQWSVDEQALVSQPVIAVPLRVAFNPSGIAVSPRNGNLVLVAARQRALLELTMAGEVVNMFTMPLERYHRQTEGIALFADGTLVLADEGGKKRGRLGVYRATE